MKDLDYSHILTASVLKMILSQPFESRLVTGKQISPAKNTRSHTQAIAIWSQSDEWNGTDILLMQKAVSFANMRPFLAVPLTVINFYR